MSLPPESREKAIARLNEQADALMARANPTPPDFGANAVGYGYRLMGEMIGGLVVGLGLGWGFDLVVGTMPWGIIAGTLIGFGISIWLALRSARKMSAKAAREFGPPRDLPDEVEDERNF
jgi:ATP synthase protein I